MYTKNIRLIHTTALKNGAYIQLYTTTFYTQFCTIKIKKISKEIMLTIYIRKYFLHVAIFQYKIYMCRTIQYHNIYNLNNHLTIIIN